MADADEQDPEADSPAATGPPLLAVEDLEVHYPITEGLLRREVGRVRAVDGVSFRVRRGETLGLVGESGSGKTSTAHAILDLESPTGGEVRFDGERVADLSGAARQAFRRRVQLVVQDPNEAFNPRMRVGEAVAEPLALHGMDDADRRRGLVESMLERVGLSASDAGRYPHEFSDGEKQRIAIARALVADPDLIVADEPTSALDERVKADVLALLDDVRREFDVSILFVSHDLDVVRRFCDRVAVMYMGELVERGRTEAVFADPAHPYTRVLRGSIPSLDPAEEAFVTPLTDDVPDPADPPSGCRFHPRCPEVIPPDDLEVPWDVWTSLAAFRFALQTGELPEPVAVALGGDGGSVGASTVRDAFELPEAIHDGTVAQAVDDAVDAVAAGDLERARDRLAGALPTVCERQRPDDSTIDDRTLRCHRYDDDVTGEPRPGPEGSE